MSQSMVRDKLHFFVICFLLIGCIGNQIQDVEARRSTRKPAKEHGIINESSNSPEEASQESSDSVEGSSTVDRDEQDASENDMQEQHVDQDDLDHDPDSDEFDEEGNSRSFIGDWIGGPIGKFVDQTTAFINDKLITPISPALGGALNAAASGINSIGHAINGSSPKNPEQLPPETPLQPVLPRMLPAVASPAGGTPYVQIIYQGAGSPQVYPASYVSRSGSDGCEEKSKLLKMKIKLLESELLELTRKVYVRGNPLNRFLTDDSDMEDDADD